MKVNELIEMLEKVKDPTLDVCIGNSEDIDGESCDIDIVMIDLKNDHVDILGQIETDC